jgi:beta-lactamase class A
MAKVTNTEVLEEVVRYSIEHEGETSTYDIPRAMTSLDADRTLLAHLKSFDGEDANDVKDWKTKTKDLDAKVIAKRIKDAEAKERKRKAEEEDSE